MSQIQGLWDMLHAWRAERGRVYTIAEDFADQLNERGNLEIGTVWGTPEIPGDMEYDRATGAYDTKYREIHRAYALHDYCCKELKARGVVTDADGKVIMTTQRQVDIAFLMEFLKGVDRVLIRLIREGQDLAGMGKEVSRLALLGVLYYKGVRKWDKFAKAFGWR